MAKKEYSVDMRDYVEIEAVHWPKEIIEKIAHKIILPVEHVQAMMKYNIITIRQLATITGVSESRIRNAMVQIIGKDNNAKSRFTICNPFPDTDYPKRYILVDEKCKDYILKSLN